MMKRASRLAIAGSQLSISLSAARNRLPGEAMPQAAATAFWQAVREHTDAFFLGGAPLWRLSLPSTAEAVMLDDAQLIEWGGALRWLRSARPAAEIRRRAQALGGHATLFRGGDRSHGVFTPLSPALAAIHKRLRAHFDPAGIFDAGRMLL